MAAEQLQILHAADLFTPQEGHLFSLLPRLQRCANVQLPSRANWTTVFGMEEKVVDFQFISIRGLSGRRCIQFAKDMRRVPVLNALSVESIDFVISVVGQGALDLCIARGRVVLFKKFVLACVEAQLLQDSFECNKASSSSRLS
jgi:hypothetical protein